MRNCEFMISEDANCERSDIYDHPYYRCYCIKDGAKKEIIPLWHCNKCHPRGLRRKMDVYENY